MADIKHFHIIKTRKELPEFIPIHDAFYIESENVTVYSDHTEVGFPQKIEGAYIPHITTDGELSWTNTLGWSNPDPVNIKGEKGEDGLGQVSAVSAVSLPYGAAPDVENTGTPQMAQLVFKIPEGPQGPQGPQGAQGAQGVAGAQGPQGATGTQGRDGTTFTPSVDSAGNLSWSNPDGKPNPPTVNIMGPQGVAGAQGATGADGATGPTGATGPAGPAGATGPAGAQGLQGQDGRTPTLQMGTVTTGAAGTSASGTLTETPQGSGNYVLDLTIPKGEQGDIAVAAMNLRGAWSASETYNKGDYVIGSDGNAYGCVEDNSVGDDPAVQPNTQWQVIALKGAKGDPGSPGAQGVPGNDGQDGQSATLAIGQVVTGAPGSSASVINSGTAQNAVLDITIPTGAQGPQGLQGIQGPAGTLTIRNVVTVPSTQPASVVNAGTANNAILDMNIPAGAAASVSVGTVTTLAPNSNVSVVNSGTTEAAVFDFSIPRGADGVCGAVPDWDKGFSLTKTQITNISSYLPGINYKGWISSPAPEDGYMYIHCYVSGTSPVSVAFKLKSETTTTRLGNTYSGAGSLYTTEITPVRKGDVGVIGGYGNYTDQGIVFSFYPLYKPDLSEEHIVGYLNGSSIYESIVQTLNNTYDATTHNILDVIDINAVSNGQKVACSYDSSNRAIYSEGDAYVTVRYTKS